MIKKLLITITLLLTLVGCTRPNETREFLINQGYTDVQTTGYKFFECGKDDTFATGFTAVNQNHRPVTGVVCEGILKGKTIRFN